MRKSIIVAAVALLLLVAGCSPKVVDVPDAPADSSGCLEVDYEGHSWWALTDSSLRLPEMKNDMIGYLEATVGAPSDSGRPVTAVFVGEFDAPLGENKFSVGGMIFYEGTLTEVDGGYELVLHVVGGIGGFDGIIGYFELIWQVWEVDVWFGGTMCFPGRRI